LHHEEAIGRRGIDERAQNDHLMNIVAQGVPGLIKEGCLEEKVRSTRRLVPQNNTDKPCTEIALMNSDRSSANAEVLCQGRTSKKTEDR